MSGSILAFGGVAVRVDVDEIGEPWFCAVDVCAILEVGTEATRRLDEDEKGLRSTQTPGGRQDLVHVNESGIYTLVLSSRKPEARAFRRWVTHEVLPSIRRTGAYSPSPAQPETRAQLLARAILEAAKEIAEKDQRIALLEPKAAALDTLADCAGRHGLQEAGKLLQQPPNKWVGWLKAAGHIHERGRSLCPRQDHIDAGRMAFKVRVVDGQEYGQSFVTPRGLVYFSARLPFPLPSPVGM